MESITLENIIKKEDTISYVFSFSDGLSNYFSGEQFWIKYPVNIENVPDSIAAVPFVCNVLPIIWLTNSKLCLKELDKAFYDCIPNVRHGYETMFPESVFSGTIVVDSILACEYKSTGQCAALFSGGLDAVNTLINHFDEKPALISIWGSDIRYDNEEGWKAVHDGIAETARRFDLPDAVIRSTFREFDAEGVLHGEFSEQLKDGWWHGVKHGLALLGHAAPYVYLNKLSTVYIASSNCPADGLVRCASSPYTDNHVRYAGCRVVHDGYEYSRQDKAGNVVNFCRETGNIIKLHACWQSQTGSNCGCCEKCYRTMAAIIAEGGNPVEYGFDNAMSTIGHMRYCIAVDHRLSKHLAEHHWHHVRGRILANMDQVKKGPYWKHIRWMEKVDFLRMETIKAPLGYRIRMKLVDKRFYKLLHRLKEKICG